MTDKKGDVKGERGSRRESQRGENNLSQNSRIPKFPIKFAECMHDCLFVCLSMPFQVRNYLTLFIKFAAFVRMLFDGFYAELQIQCLITFFM